MEDENTPRFSVPSKMEVQNAPRFGVPPKMEVQNVPRFSVPSKMEVFLLMILGDVSKWQFVLHLLFFP